MKAAIFRKRVLSNPSTPIQAKRISVVWL